MRLKKMSTTNNKNFYLAAHSRTDSMIADQFRAIRTNIKFLTNKNEENIILFTSPGVGEGKSTAIANLAVSMAQQKEKVLLIDANLRDSIMHDIFNVSNDTGLTNILKGITPIADAINYTDVKYLNVLTSGLTADNPTELLGSDNMTALLETVGAEYDVVLIDSPTVLKSTDTSVVANQCTGVILVVNQGKTSMENVIEAKRILDLAHSRLIGVIFNTK